MVPARGSHELINPRGSPQRRESVSPGGSVSDLDGVSGGLDSCASCSHDTNFESNLCVHNLSLKLSQGALEKSAWAHSGLNVPSSGETGSDQGTVRKMALSMTK